MRSLSTAIPLLASTLIVGCGTSDYVFQDDAYSTSYSASTTRSRGDAYDDTDYQTYSKEQQYYGDKPVTVVQEPVTSYNDNSDNDHYQQDDDGVDYYSPYYSGNGSYTSCQAMPVSAYGGWSTMYSGAYPGRFNYYNMYSPYSPYNYGFAYSRYFNNSFYSPYMMYPHMGHFPYGYGYPGYGYYGNAFGPSMYGGIGYGYGYGFGSPYYGYGYPYYGSGGYYGGYYGGDTYNSNQVYGHRGGNLNTGSSISSSNLGTVRSASNEQVPLGRYKPDVHSPALTDMKPNASTGSMTGKDRELAELQRPSVVKPQVHTQPASTPQSIQRRPSMTSSNQNSTTSKRPSIRPAATASRPSSQGGSYHTPHTIPSRTSGSHPQSSSPSRPNIPSAGHQGGQAPRPMGPSGGSSGSMGGGSRSGGSSGTNGRSGSSRRGG